MPQRSASRNSLPLSEFRVAELRFIGISLNRIFGPENAGDLRRLHQALCFEVAVRERRTDPRIERLAKLGCERPVVPFAGVVDDIDAAGSVGIEQIIAGGVGVIGPAIGKGTHRRPEVGVPHENSVDILPVNELQRPEHFSRQFLIERDICRPCLRPLEIGNHRVEGERLLQYRVVRRVDLGDAGIEGGPEIRISARVRDHVADPDKREASREDHRAAPQLRRAIAADIPVESDPRREERLCACQLALIDSLRVAIFV